MVLSAYSDGSVTGRGVAGSAAIVIETADGEVVATIRLTSTDVALSSGRTEWVGLVMVLIAAASTQQKLSCGWTTFRLRIRLTTVDAGT